VSAIQYIFLSVFLVLNVTLGIVTFFYAAELIAALLPARRSPDASPASAPATSLAQRPAVAVLVPAHDEEIGISATLAAIRAALLPTDRLVVVADNCTDGTAGLARMAGADVVERDDPVRRGKGYALDAGVRHLASSPPAIVVIVDADCFPDREAIDRLAMAVMETNRPVQSLYLMTAPAGSGVGMKVAEFTFMLKNKVRQRGLQRLGLPCRMTGSGMAFPWRTIETLKLADGHLAEDMKMGLELAVAGAAPAFCEGAVVLSPFPQTVAGLQTQRRRWIGGHIALISAALASIPASLARGNGKALMAAIATAVPPLTLLLGLLLGAALLTIGTTFALGLGMLPVALSIVNLIVFLGSTASAWFAFGRQILPGDALGAALGLILKRMLKAPFAFYAARRESWVRTDRTRTGD
jgi:cellulose synthase/poly-beta-1,6-N-acetylglucosamine synthase-like glycosyltransferase